MLATIIHSFYDNTVYIIDRSIFDKTLADLVIKNGTELITGANVIGHIREDGVICGNNYHNKGLLESVKCNIIIGCDGIQSRFGRLAGIDTHLELEDIYSCIQYRIPGIGLFIRMH